MAERVAIALGSNLGDRDGYLAAARAGIASLPDTTMVAATAPEETAPVGPVRQGAFLNQMVLVETGLEPRELLGHLLALEARCGRTRTERWGPRTLDCDIVLFGERAVQEPGLVIPHPELGNRPFWLRELKELDVRIPA